MVETTVVDGIKKVVCFNFKDVVCSESYSNLDLELAEEIYYTTIECYLENRLTNIICGSSQSSLRYLDYLSEDWAELE